jgi:drug/metabolite transporter (DMT)-like permease
VVQGVYGLFGAVGLAVLLRERTTREMFVKAASAVALFLALWMIAAYDERTSRFFGDRDLVGTDVGAAFLLLPTLVAASALYGRRGEEEAERDYRGVLWAALLLLALLGAGLRTRSVAWVYGLGVGAAVLVWMLLPRWRVLAPLVAALVLVAAAQQEVRRCGLAHGPFEDKSEGRQARLDKADWELWRGGGLGQRVAGRGAGTFFLAYDQQRSLETYAARGGDMVVGHARRQAVEVLVERGVIGVVLAVLAGAACVAAGVVCARRATEGLDGTVAAGLAAAAPALGLFACASNGGVGFGASLAFWMGVGLLGALTAVYGREAGLSYSVEEEAGRAERGAARGPGRVLGACGGGVAALVLWFVLGAQPFWAEVRLREGIEEHKGLTSLIIHYKSLQSRWDEFSPDERAYVEARRVEQEQGVRSGELKALEAKLPKKVVDRLEAFMDSVQTGRVNFLEATRRTRGYLRAAAALSLGDRVWLTAQINLLRYAIDHFAMDEEVRDDVLAVGARLEAFCGSFGTVDLERARFCFAIGRFAEAHRLFHRYARKNPFAAMDAEQRSSTDVYQYWVMMIAQRLRAGDARAAAWAEDLRGAVRTALDFDPTRYAILARWEQFLYEVGRVEEAYMESLRVVRLVEAELAERHPPAVQASLLLDAARVVRPWDPDQALGIVSRVFLLGIDFDASENRWLLSRALALAREIGLPPVSGPPPRPSRPSAPVPGKSKSP